MKNPKTNISKTILYTGLPTIFLYLIYLIVSINSHSNTSREVIIHIYSPQLKHVILSLTILLIGALLFDITEKEIYL